MNKKEVLLQTMRLPFIILTPACILLGAGTAFRAVGQMNWFHFVLVMVGGISAHLSVNTFNEYFDFKSGLDAQTRRTPFSGGSGALPAHPEYAGNTLIAAWLTLFITALIGIYFSITIGPGLLPLGLVGIFLLYGYTVWMAKNPFFCLIAPGLGFGTCMVLGTHYVLAGSFSWAALMASMIPFFLVNNLLLLNQFPDIEADKKSGRKHLLVQYGKSTGIIIYSLFLGLTYLTLIAGVILDIFPVWSFLGLATILLAGMIVQGLVKHGPDNPLMLKYMGMNVLINLLTPVLISVGLFLA